jgi:hypothetical protein
VVARALAEPPQRAGIVGALRGMIPETDHKRLHKNRMVLLITPNIPKVLGTIPAQRWGASAAPNASWAGLIRKSPFVQQLRHDTGIPDVSHGQDG